MNNHYQVGFNEFGCWATEPQALRVAGNKPVVAHFERIKDDQSDDSLHYILLFRPDSALLLSLTLKRWVPWAASEVFGVFEQFDTGSTGFTRIFRGNQIRLELVG